MKKPNEVRGQRGRATPRHRLVSLQQLPSPARKLALDLILSVREPESPGFDVRLDDARRTGAMSGQDIALSREIAFGVARHRPWLETILARYLHKALPAQAYQVRDALLIGIYQAAFLDRIPAHTIVDETVKLVASVRTEAGYRSLANAIMRKVVTAPREEFIPTSDTTWPIVHGVPEWLSSEAGQVFKGDDLVAFFASSNEAAPLCLRATVLAQNLSDIELLEKLKTEIATHAHADAEITASPFLPRSFQMRGRAIAPDHLPSFRAGLFTVEDEGAQVVSHLAGADAGKSILDLCASPGGKTANIADIAGRKFQRFVACDVSVQKLDRLRDTLKRLHLADAIDVKLLSAFVDEPDREQFDVVLVDAPCSALGTMRRHPEVRWKRAAKDLRAISRQQYEILEQASACVKPGGTLVYSVCTFTRAETDSVVDRFLQDYGGEFEADVAPTGLPFDASRFGAGKGRWRTSPQRDGCDAFFVARLRSKAS